LTINHCLALLLGLNQYPCEGKRICGLVNINNPIECLIKHPSNYIDFFLYQIINILFAEKPIPFLRLYLAKNVG